MKTITLPKHEILCWSEIKNEFVPTAHPKFDSASQAREYGDAKIKVTDFIVRPVR